MKGKTLLKAWNDFRAHMLCGDNELAKTAFYSGAAWAAVILRERATVIRSDALEQLAIESAVGHDASSEPRQNDKTAAVGE